MDEEIEELAKRAVKVAEKLPEKFQEKGFEVLPNAFLLRELPSPSPPERKEGPPAARKEFIVPIDVRAFLQQYNVPEESLTKLFFMHEKEVRPIYKIKTTKKAIAQTQIALLAALESALKGGKFEFGLEDVRQRCKDLGAYDAPNFTSIFRA